MSGKKILQPIGLIVLIISIAGCGQTRYPLTVSEVWQNAALLDGRQIRVRGQGHLRFEPYHPLQVGGCSLDQELVNKSHIVGIQDLLDEDSPDVEQRLSISRTSLHCEGNVCSLECKPFEPMCGRGVMCVGGLTAIEAFEFVGTLKVSDQQGELELILENIDLNKSKRFVDGEWSPIPTGVFSYFFP
jgi:hypothetical protein